MTFTVEDALISPISLAMLTGAGLSNVTDADNTGKHYIYQPVQFDLPIIAGDDDGNTGVVRIDYDTAQDAHDIYYSQNKGQIFGTVLDNAGAGVYFLPLSEGGIKMMHSNGTEREGYKGECVPNDTDAGHVFTIPANDVDYDASDATAAHPGDYLELTFEGAEKYIGNTLRVDCYCQRSSGATQITIDAENFAGDFYIEASTLFRDQYTKKDMPAVFVIPDAKIQSNFTFTMANSGDPSTFTFTMDAFPDYTKFDHTKKVFCAIQIMGDENVVPQTDNVVKDECEALKVEVVKAEAGENDDNLVRNFKAEVNRRNIDFFGMVNPVADYSGYKTIVKTLLGGSPSDKEVAAELTGYYVPVKFTVEAPKGTATTDCTIKLRSIKSGKTLTASGADGTISTVIAISADKPVIEADVSNGTDTETYTFDFSKCVFR